MGYSPRHNLSFCETGGRLLFLDIERDRYFCLTPSSEESFRRLMDGDHDPADDAFGLRQLVADGLLVRVEAEVQLQACGIGQIPTRSLLDEPLTASSFAVAGALARQAAASLALKLLPLRTVVGQLRRQKERVRDVPGDTRDAQHRVASAFHLASQDVSSLDRCLPRSIAVAHALLALGLRPDLIFGVRLNPFAAHCWVQCDDQLVNERLDEVRNFTPILVL